MPNIQPFIDFRAFDKSTSAYVTFQTQSDALLASLLLFHDVPCRIMDLIFSVITHPDFDTNQITMRDSTDIVIVAEEARLKDRMAVMRERSMNSRRVVEQAGFPQVILLQVLDIIDADRVHLIKDRFVGDLGPGDMSRESNGFRFLNQQNAILSNMSLVHRSWTLPAQKALGRSIYMGRPIHEMKSLLQPSFDKSVLGPWTSLIAVDLYRQVKKEWRGGVVNNDSDDSDDSDDENSMLYDYDHDERRYYEYEYDSEDEDEDKFRPVSENLHRLLVGFDNLKCFIIRSHTDFFTKWSNATIGALISRNPRLEELTLLAKRGRFILDPLIRSSNIRKNLKSMVTQGELISTPPRAYQERGFTGLKNLKIKCLSYLNHNDFAFLSILATQPGTHLESLTISRQLYYPLNDAWGANLTRAVSDFFTPQICRTLFEHIRVLRVEYASFKWVELIGPYCTNLRYLSIKTDCNQWPHFSNAIPHVIQNLDVDLFNVRNMPSLEWSKWSEEMLELPKLNRFPHIQSLDLHLEKSSFYSKVEVLHEKMKAVCQEAGIEYR